MLLSRSFLVQLMKGKGYLHPWFQKLLGLESKKSVASDHTLVMLSACERLEVDPDLRAVVTSYNKSEVYAWFQTTVLHVWLCLGRLYSPPLEQRELMAQEMSDHLFSRVEDQLLAYGITNPMAFNREYKRLCQIFHGTCLAYDKAYSQQSDEALSRALWRNLLNQDPQSWDKSSPHLPSLVAYVKKQKVVLKFADPDAFAKGVVPFAPYAGETRCCCCFRDC
jgi:hypothetical protein